MKNFIEVTKCLMYAKEDIDLKGYWKDNYGYYLSKEQGNYIQYRVVLFDYNKFILNIDSIQRIEQEFKYIVDNTNEYLVKIFNREGTSFIVKESYDEIKKMLKDAESSESSIEKESL